MVLQVRSKRGARRGYGSECLCVAWRAAVSVCGKQLGGIMPWARFHCEVGVQGVCGGLPVGGRRWVRDAALRRPVLTVSPCRRFLE